MHCMWVYLRSAEEDGVAFEDLPEGGPAPYVGSVRRTCAPGGLAMKSRQKAGDLVQAEPTRLSQSIHFDKYHIDTDQQDFFPWDE